MEASYLGELVAQCVCPSSKFSDAVSCLRFDSCRELIWAGTHSGMIHTLQCPHLQRHASWKGHSSHVLDMQLVGVHMLSLSAQALTLHACGGSCLLHVTPSEGEVEWESLALEPGSGMSRLLLGDGDGCVSYYDLGSQQWLSSTAQVVNSRLTHLRAPAGRGCVVAGTASGHLHLLDPRKQLQSEASSLAYVGGVAALEVKGDLIATAGFNKRAGALIPDSMVKVFDARAALRPLFTLPSLSPGLLSWHPLYPTTLLMASGNGLFSILDVSNPATTTSYQVHTAGDTLCSVDTAPSGEAMCFGGSGGYVHLWCYSPHPATLPYGQVPIPVAHPHMASQPAVRFGEEGPFSLAATYYPEDGVLLSDLSDQTSMAVGLPPRVVDPALKNGMDQVDFVGYISNPHYVRGKPAGEARRAAAKLQRQRQALVSARQEAQAVRAERLQRRVASGAAVLPARYKRVVIRSQAGVRFEEFDFSYYNRTCFAGLENDLPNCYCNALLQVLYFTPPLRAAILAHAPELQQDFCMACELMFLFRMLYAEAGTPCQASNLLRALKQNREAAALGLLDGASGPGGGGAGAVEARVLELEAKQLALARRIVSLSRFLLEHLHKECRGEAPPSPGPSSAAATAAAVPVSPALTHPATPTAASTTPTSTTSGGSGATQVSVTGDQQLAAALVEVFGLEYRLDTTALSGASSGKTISRHARCFQVDLIYPSNSSSNSSSAHPPRPASAAGSAASSPMRATPPANKATPASTPDSSATPKPGQQQQQLDQSAGKAPPPLELPPTALEPPTSPAPPAAATAGGDRQLPVTASPGTPRFKGHQASPGAPMSPLPASVHLGRSGEGAAGGLSAAAAGPGSRPAFVDLLAASLRAESTARAWFDDAGGYSWVRQARHPQRLPRVLAISCPPTCAADVALWQPTMRAGGPYTPAAATAADPAAGGGPTPDKQQLLQQQQPGAVPSPGGAPPAAPAAAGGSGSSPLLGSGLGHGSPSPAAAAAAAGTEPWLPMVMAVQVPTSCEEGVQIVGGQSWGQLDLSSSGGGWTRYELTALVCHIRDADEDDDFDLESTNTTSSSSGAAGGRSTPVKTPTGSKASPAAYQGHLVALIRVPQQYLQEKGGLYGHNKAAGQRTGGVKPAAGPPGKPAAEAAAAAGGGGAAAPSAGATPATSSNSSSTTAAQGTAAAAAAAAGKQQQLEKGSCGGSGGLGSFALPDDLVEVLADLVDLPTGSSSQGGGGAATADSTQQQQPDAAAAPEGDTQQQQEEAVHAATAAGGQPKEAAVAAAGGGGVGVPPGSSSSDQQQQQPAADGQASSSSSGPSTQGASQAAAEAAARAAAGAAAGVGVSGSPATAQWVVFNDFCITPIHSSEVLQWYGNQKLPCLLYYAQVDPPPAAPAAAPPLPPPPAPLQLPATISAAQFAALCAAPPLQGAGWRGPRSFKPLDMRSEAPGPGMLVALDAEFVALTRPETSYESGGEVTLKTSRLALARVSVLRGSGPHTGVSLMDDYIRCVEPVVDYLTRFSGIHPGDLDPLTSTHYLVALKTSYLKLRYLLEAGVTFVGHGLKQDFRIINLTVPPEQVCDTVELWSYRRARKLSLRFLSWALLGRSIQDKPSGHDSVEDAGTALALYNKYCQLQAQGKFQEVLQQLYAWGKEHGWDPAAAAARGVAPPLSGATPPAGGSGVVGVRRALVPT